MLNLVKHRYIFLGVSLLVIIPGLISLAFNGLNAGIDFTGGSIWNLTFSSPKTAVTAEAVTQTVRSAVNNDASFQSVLVQLIEEQGAQAGQSISLRTPFVTAGPMKDGISNALVATFGPYTENTFGSIGPSVGAEITVRSAMAVGLVSLGILGYLSWAFRKVKRPLRYGLCAVVAMLHDVLIVVGIFSILGVLFNVLIDALFVTALLTVIGFSVHDTIVVFDRIRENAIRSPGEEFGELVNYSLLQTLARSVVTSLTTIFTLSALFLFGGESIRNFVLALLIGIISGTYSSIFNASMLLVIWERGEYRTWFKRRRLTPAA